ncbi:hypothetical protein [Cohnella faecalis]|uniref:hypothetical protein n=1 Tax=Cohnella faecalis TaxID=2315694 RepID=UPI001F2E62EB|nr:hypothetical protein [Cohnella faecalis]
MTNQRNQKVHWAAQSYDEAMGYISKNGESLFEWISIAVGVAIAVAGTFASHSILRWTGGSATMIASGDYYLELRFYAMAFGIVSFAIHGFCGELEILAPR